MTRRLALITTLFVLAVAAPVSAQTQSDPFSGGLPAPEPTATATVDSASSTDNETGRNVLFIIGGALIIGFAVMGYMITRDARGAAAKVGDDVDHDRVRNEALHKRQQLSKTKTRKKTRAQKQARKVQHSQRKR